MNGAEFRIGIEELAYAMGVIGGSDMAAGFLLALLGERSTEEQNGRLLAASHALVARELMSFDIETAEKSLRSDFAAIIRLLVDSQFIIRLTNFAERGEETISFYFGDNGVVEHTLQQEVVSRLRWHKDVRSVRFQSQEFFGISFEDNHPQGAQPLINVPASMLDAVRDRRNEISAENVAERLILGGMPTTHAHAFAIDLFASSARGSVLRIERKDNQTVADNGLLLMFGRERSWILEIVPQDPPMLNVFAGTSAIFDALLTKLISAEI